jgi:hypothetical protein
MMVNKAGRQIKVNDDQVGEKEKAGYKIADGAAATAPPVESGASEETAVTSDELKAFTVNDLKEFCEEMEIDTKAGWNKADYIDALIEADFTPPPIEE